MARSKLYALAVVFALLLAAMPVQAQEQVEITLWHHWARTDLIEEMIKTFEARYPWIKVNHSFSSTAGAADRLGTLLVSGAAPEVLMVRSLYVYQFMSIGAFYPLDELAARDGLDLSIFNPGDLRSFQYQGKTYAFPSMSGSAWTNLYFYNKDIMDLSGLDSENPPKTWDDWKAATVRMTKLDGNDNIIQAGSTIPYLSDAAAWNGAVWWSDDWTTADTLKPDILETAEYLRDVVTTAYPSYAAYNTFNRAGASFWEGLTGIYFTNNSGFGLAQDVSFRWGAATAPINSRNPNSRPMNIVSSAWSYALPNDIDEKKLEAAWLLLKFLTTDEDGGGFFARAQGRPSPVIEFNRHPNYLHTPYWNVVLEALQYEVTAPPGVMAPMQTAGGEIFYLNKTPVQALTEAQIQVQLALDAYWSSGGN